MITARTWFVPWASRGESAGTNSEDAESDQSRQNGYAVEDMQHQSKQRQQKESQSGQQQRLEGGTDTAGGRRGFWSNGTGSSIEETTAGQKKGAGLGPGEGGGATFRGIQGFSGERLAVSCWRTPEDRRKASRLVAGSRKAQIRPQAVA